MLLTFLSRNFPTILFIFIWIVVFAMYLFNPFSYYEIRTFTFLILTLSIFSVVLGMVLSTLYYRKGKIVIISSQSIDDSFKFNLPLIEKMILTTSLIALVGVIINVKLLSEKAGGLVDYFRNPIIARAIVVESYGKISTGWNILQSFANYLINFNYLGSILGGIVFALKDKKRFIGFIPLLSVFIHVISTFQRYFFVYNFSLWLFTMLTVSNLYSGNKKKKIVKKVLRVGIYILAFFILFSLTLISIRVSFTTKGIKTEKINEWILESNYSYVAANVVTLDRFLIKGPDMFYHGGSIFRNILKWFARVGLWDEERVREARYEFRKVSPKIKHYYNTYTFIRQPYEDFGIVGVVVISFLWGAIGNWLYQSIRRKFSFLRLYFVGVFLFSYFLSFYTFAMQTITLFLYMGVLIWTIERFIIKPGHIYKLTS